MKRRSLDDFSINLIKPLAAGNFRAATLIEIPAMMKLSGAQMPFNLNVERRSLADFNANLVKSLAVQEFSRLPLRFCDKEKIILRSIAKHMFVWYNGVRI